MDISDEEIERRRLKDEYNFYMKAEELYLLRKLKRRESEAND